MSCRQSNIVTRSAPAGGRSAASATSNETRSATPAAVGPPTRDGDRALVVVQAQEAWRPGTPRPSAPWTPRDRSPTSTTWPPASSTGTTPSSAGSQDDTRFATYPGRKNRSVPSNSSASCWCQPNPSPVRKQVSMAATSRSVASGELHARGEERRAVGLREREGLLGCQRPGVGRGVVLDVPSRRLVGQPRPDVGDVGAGAVGERLGRDGLAVGHRAVEAEAVAEEDAAGAERGPDVADHPADERLEEPHVELAGLGGGGHEVVSSRGVRVVPGPVEVEVARPPSGQRQSSVNGVAGRTSLVPCSACGSADRCPPNRSHQGCRGRPWRSRPASGRAP